MRRVFTTSRFERRLKSFTIQHPRLVREIAEVMLTVARDYRQESLKAHRLHGNLKDCFAVRLSYEYRIVFVIEKESVTFIDIGDHDDVYR